jgi:MFS family permease
MVAARGERPCRHRPNRTKPNSEGASVRALPRGLTGVASERDAASEASGIGLILRDPPVLVVTMIVFVIQLGFGLVAPVLPLYARSFGVSYDEASLLISAYAFARLLSDPLVGPLIDRFGVRWTSIAGAVILAGSSLLAGLAGNFALVVVFRAVGGAGTSLVFAALYSYLLKIVPSNRMGRTMSVFYGALNIGIIAGAPLGGLAAHFWGLASPLFVYAGLALASAVLYLRFMPDPDRLRVERFGAEAADVPPPPTGVIATWRQIRTLLSHRAFVTAIVLNLAFFWVIAGGYDTLIPLFGKESLGMSPLAVGVVFSLAVMGEFVVLYPAGSRSDRIGRKPVAAASLIGLGVMMAALGFAGHAVVLGVLMTVTGFCSGAFAATPSAMLADVAPESGSGTAVGVFRFAGDVGFVVGPTVAGAMASAFGFRAAFIGMAAPIVLALALLARTHETLGRAKVRT